MSGALIASVMTAVLTVAGTLLATFKWKPGQKDTTEAAVGQMQIDIATGALKLVTSGLTEEVERLKKALSEARGEIEKLSAEVERLMDEVEMCRKRHTTQR